MLPYQENVVEKFVQVLRPSTRQILEIGSDMGGEVATAIAQRTGAVVFGVNPSKEFPASAARTPSNVKLLKADGRSLPFSDGSFDAILSVATMEHVNGLDIFLSEVTRVLKPKGVFYTEFSPIWSSARGHHVYAVVGAKEARFWKPGKNPIPDYAHLLMTPDEMREYLRSGPCTEELIEPIIQWIYFGDSINRCHYEEYMEAFRKCPLATQNLYFGYDNPSHETLTALRIKYGAARDFYCSFIAGMFRKPPKNAVHGLIFKNITAARKIINRWSTRYTLIRLIFHIRTFLFRFIRT